MGCPCPAGHRTQDSNSNTLWVAAFSGVGTALSSTFVEARAKLRLAGLGKCTWGWSEASALPRNLPEPTQARQKLAQEPETLSCLGNPPVLPRSATSLISAEDPRAQGSHCWGKTVQQHQSESPLAAQRRTVLCKCKVSMCLRHLTVCSLPVSWLPGP